MSNVQETGRWTLRLLGAMVELHGMDEAFQRLMMSADAGPRDVRTREDQIKVKQPAYVNTAVPTANAAMGGYVHAYKYLCVCMSA